MYGFLEVTVAFPIFSVLISIPVTIAFSVCSSYSMYAGADTLTVKRLDCSYGKNLIIFGLIVRYCDKNPSTCIVKFSKTEPWPCVSIWKKGNVSVSIRAGGTLGPKRTIKPGNTENL